MMINKKQSKTGIIKYALIIPVLALIAIIVNAKTSIISSQDSKQTDETIIVDHPSHDFGSIKENGGKVSTTFTITNKGNKPITISNVTASCGCTTPKWTKDPIAPDKKGKIEATYDPKGRPGPFHKTISVYIAGEETEPMQLIITGTVVSEK